MFYRLRDLVYMLLIYTGLFEMIVGVLTICHLVLQMQSHVISFYGVTSRIRFMFLLFPRKYPGTEGTNQNRHWNHHRWHAERTGLSCWCVLNHKGCTYRASVRCVTETGSVVIFNKKNTLLSRVYCIWQVVKTPTIISNNPVLWIENKSNFKCKIT